jgi:hypothetical protein
MKRSIGNGLPGCSSIPASSATVLCNPVWPKTSGGGSSAGVLASGIAPPSESSDRVTLSGSGSTRSGARLASDPSILWATNGASSFGPASSDRLAPLPPNSRQRRRAPIDASIPRSESNGSGCSGSDKQQSPYADDETKHW